MALFHVSHLPWLRLVGVRTSYIHFSNISWTPWVLDPITSPFLGPPSWLHPASAWQGHSNIKAMLTVFSDWEDVVHHKYAPSGQTINKEYCLNVLCWLRGTIWQKWPQLWATGDWQLYHNNASAYASHLMQSFLAKHQIIQVTQPPTAQILCPGTSGFSQN